jgi:SagB-type dehydrogenase family enzyme
VNLATSLSSYGDLVSALEEILRRRRSIRDFAATRLTKNELHHLLWAAQGITDPEGRRAAPSAGAEYSLDLNVVTDEAIYHYDPPSGGTSLVASGDFRPSLQHAAVDQASVGQAPATIVVAGTTSRLESRFGPELAHRSLLLEAGHAAENVLLEAVALGLGAMPLGHFDGAAVGAILGLASDCVTLELIPVGHSRT